MGGWWVGDHLAVEGHAVVDRHHPVLNALIGAFLDHTCEIMCAVVVGGWLGKPHLVDWYGRVYGELHPTNAHRSSMRGLNSPQFGKVRVCRVSCGQRQAES